MPETPFADARLKRALQNIGDRPDASPDLSVGSKVDRPGVGIAPYAAAIGGQAADALSSVYNFKRGYGESNFGGSKTAMLATKAALGALVPIMMHKIGKTDSKMAKVLGYATGIAGGIPAAYNLSLPDPGKR